MGEFRGEVLEDLVARYFADAGLYGIETVLARPLDAIPDGQLQIAPMQLPLGREGAVREFVHLHEVKPGAADAPILWRPKSKNMVATDLLLTVGRIVYFLQCTVSNTHELIVRTPKCGLLDQADALASGDRPEVERFDTAGAVNVVHVTEDVTEPTYTRGELKVTEKRDGMSKSTTRKARPEEGSRVRQWVVGVRIPAPNHEGPRNP
jgi:hypothetical protein